ncbi:hypothetical protein ACFWNT_00860 [Streptomyces sp. NPDC058409]|uniref:hypothetical protein n=1 Tax=Streptomyces sp. NPDC058409 TaxID=3346484 RepID=UPI0036591187
MRGGMDAHRPWPADPEPAQAIAVLARAQQDVVWDRGQEQNRLCSQLREFCPTVLAAGCIGTRCCRLTPWRGGMSTASPPTAHELNESKPPDGVAGKLWTRLTTEQPSTGRTPAVGATRPVTPPG